ncbi:MAG: phage head closure protein [Clostridium saudiense]|uniref:phage head closure protein n=1 Tax=Clostridium saudiense TaxID=1414720 RepID=UPI0021FAB688|nr:phage head closure protein [Clostridium saudiense]MDU3522225.1 phage head closure protein [Clostridium saudiense]UVX78389.1 MAG: head-tail joining protein [Bacteriophage sp.]
MNDVIELECVAYKESDDIGDAVKGEAYWNRIYANKKSITQSEFYQAQAQGFKPELKFEINSFEYEDNKKIRYKGKVYKILRTYEVSSEKMEIVCIGNINGNS